MSNTPTELPEDINKVPKAASQPIGAVWVKGEYDRLYDQVKGGKRTVCFVDYRYGHVDQEQVCRDICTIDNEGWEFFARGIGYGRLSYAMKKYGMAQDSAFVKICEEMNVEWLDESPTAAGETEESIFDQYRAIKEKIGKLGYNTFINSIEVEQYREWLRNDRYKHRIEWFEKEYPNGLYSKDDDGELFGVNIMTKKFLAEADAAYDKPTAAGDGKEDAVAFIAAVTEEGAEMWKMEYDSCRKILEELVDLKDIKDREGKTDDYLMRQPVAWVRAKRFLEKYQHINW